MRIKCREKKLRKEKISVIRASKGPKSKAGDIVGQEARSLFPRREFPKRKKKHRQLVN